MVSSKNYRVREGVKSSLLVPNRHPTVLSTSLGKNVCLLLLFFFAWHFILNEIFCSDLTISYQKPFVFSVSMFCSQIFTLKLNLRPKIGLTYAISIVKFV